jgi:hypothetical protein
MGMEEITQKTGKRSFCFVNCSFLRNLKFLDSRGDLFSLLEILVASLLCLYRTSTLILEIELSL